MFAGGGANGFSWPDWRASTRGSNYWMNFMSLGVQSPVFVGLGCFDNCILSRDELLTRRRASGSGADLVGGATQLCCMRGATPLCCMRGHSRCTMPLLCIGMRRWTIHPRSPLGARLFVGGLFRPLVLRRSVCLVRSLQFADVVTFVAFGRVHALDEGVATFSARSAGDDICTAMVQRKQG